MKLKFNNKFFKIYNSREGYIDSLRGLSILFVIIFHYTYHYNTEYLLRTDNWSLDIAKYGWSGVDIFFVISGYCIGMTIVKISSFSEFIFRRFARLYPAYLFCGILTLIFFTFFELPGREVDWFTGFMNLIFANFIPGVNYKYIDGIYWALIVEIKFYLIFGALFYLQNDLNKSINYWFGICIIGNLLLLVNKDNYIFITSIFPHANLFLVGLVLFNFNKVALPNTIIIFLFVILSFFIQERYNNNEYYFIILLIFVSILLLKKINISFKILPHIGLLSYTWYLTHNAIGIIIIRELNRLNYQGISVISAILATLLISFLIYNLIELKLKKIIINFYKKNLHKI